MSVVRNRLIVDVATCLINGTDWIQVCEYGGLSVQARSVDSRWTLLEILAFLCYSHALFQVCYRSFSKAGYESQALLLHMSVCMDCNFSAIVCSLSSATLQYVLYLRGGFSFSIVYLQQMQNFQNTVQRQQALALMCR